jgi:hypothetical protein
MIRASPMDRHEDHVAYACFGRRVNERAISLVIDRFRARPAGARESVYGGDHGLAAEEEAAQICSRAEIPGDHLYVRWQVRRAVRISGQHSHALALLQKQSHDVRPEQAGSPGDADHRAAT